MDVEKNQRMIEYMKQNSYGYNKSLSKENHSEDDLSKMYKKSLNQDVLKKDNTNQEKTEMTDQEIIQEEIEKYVEEENETFDEEVTSPLHILLYGLAHHEVADCRSVVNSHLQHHVSYIFQI